VRAALSHAVDGAAGADEHRAFEEFFFDVCTMDYTKMQQACEPLKALMERTDRVRLVGPGTDLSFSIKDIGVIPCFGTHNIPDGECFTAPVKDSVNGTITFNAPTIEHGVTHENVRFEMKDGKIIEATSSNTEKLNEVLDTDEGARYIGEFSIAFNPLHYAADERYSVRRENRRQLSLHARPSLRRSRQRQPQRSALGLGQHPARRLRRRRNLLR
jgi:aminopeptidase